MGLIIKSSSIYLVLKSTWTFIKDHTVKCICASWKSHAHQYPSPSYPSYSKKKKNGGGRGKNKTIQYLKEFLSIEV